MFDPYHKWLGIPRDRRPPTFYQLLAIAPTEDDPEVIEAASIRQSAYVRNFQKGPHAADCSRILGEIAQARATLLDSSKRTDYDATYRGRISASCSPAGASSTPDGRDGSDNSIASGDVSAARFWGRLGFLVLALAASIAVAITMNRNFHSSSRSTSADHPTRPSIRNDARTHTDSAEATKDAVAEVLPGISHLDQGKIYIQKKEYDRGIGELSEAIRSDPKIAEAYHQRGLCHVRKGELDPAITDFSTAIKLGSEQSYAARGEAFYHMGSDTKAIADIDKALQLDAKDHHAYQVKALVMSKKGDYRSALTLLQTAQSIHPSSEYLIGIGQACEYLNDGYNAIASYSRAIRLDPESATAYGHRAWQFVRLQMYGPAIADYDIGLSIDPKNAWLLTGRGMAFIKAGDITTALSSYDRAIEADPGYALAYFHRSWAYRMKGDASRADADRRKAISLDPSQAAGDAFYR